MAKTGFAPAASNDVARMLGIIGETRRTRVTALHASIEVEVDSQGALLCPLCPARFYSAEDLARHLAFHARSEYRGLSQRSE